jgi:hypothetical protein
MGIYAKTVLFARRLSVFYILVAVLSIFFGVFFYRFMPDNEAELNTRGVYAAPYHTAKCQSPGYRGCDVNRCLRTGIAGNYSQAHLKRAGIENRTNK